MAQKKAHEVDGWLRPAARDVAIVLIYGPDRGLVSERRESLCRKDRPAARRPVLGGAARCRARSSATRAGCSTRPVPCRCFPPAGCSGCATPAARKSLADDVKALSAEPPRDAIILIEAGDLKKGVGAARSRRGAARIGMALPCYGDEDRDIDTVIDDELARPAWPSRWRRARRLRRNLGGDRLATRGEIAKLALYAHGQREIELDDVAP